MYYTSFGFISWDDRKNAANFAKHRVRFEDAVTIFRDPYLLIGLNPHPEGNRMDYLGQSTRQDLLFVVTVEAGDWIRLVSARHATRRERQGYAQGI